MIRYVQLAALLATVILAQTTCASGAGGTHGAGNARVQDFSAVRDKTWKLMTVYDKGMIVYVANNNNTERVLITTPPVFERSMLAQEAPNDVFTLRFDAERVSGVGCPNRYFAPYALSKKQAIDIKPIAGTLMAALFEPEQLKEREFFAYLEKADEWDILRGNLVLRSKNNEGAAVFLVFSLAD